MWEDTPSQILKNKRIERPKTYYQLIQRVGADGAYQFRMFMIFMLIWFYTGIILMNTNFLFYNKDFECKQKGLIVGSCEQVVCELSPQFRTMFINEDDSYFKSIATQLGQFHCEDEIYINLAKCSVYIGSLIGFLVFSYWSDNIGRKKSILISISICVLGNIIVSANTNLILASFGLLLSGAGANASINTTLCFFNQVTTDYKRQKYTVLVQLSFTMGAILVTCFYFLIAHWRIISIFLITVPSLVSLFLVLFYVQQTTQFLIKDTNTQALKAFNKIGNINFKIKNIIEEQDLLQVKQSQTASKEFNELQLKYIDLWRFTSLRKTTVLTSFLCFVIYAMYYGSITIINSLGFDIYASSFIIQLAQLVIYLPIYVYIKQMKRKVIEVISFGILIIISGILVFVEIPSNCNGNCSQGIIQLVFTFFFRSIAAFYFCVFYLHINELYPSRITGLGVGTVSAFGVLASILSPVVFQLFNNNILMVFFCILSLIGVAITSLMNQTQGKKINEQIQQIKMLKDRQKSLISNRTSFARYSLIKSVVKVQKQ